MRILLATFDADTHFYNMVPLAWAFRSAGHEVYVAGPPQMERHTVAAGLTHVSIGLEQDLMAYIRDFPRDKLAHGTGFHIREDRPDVLTAEYATGVLRSWYSEYCIGFMGDEKAVKDICTFALHWKPDLVLWDVLGIAGQVAAKVSGALSARILFGRDHFVRLANALTKHGAWDENDNPIADLLRQRLALVGSEFDPSMLFGDVTIDPNPSFSYDPWDHPRLKMQFVPYNGPSTVPDWLTVPAERRRVAFTLGLSLRQMGDDRFTVRLGDLLDAFGAVDAEVVATLDAEQMMHVPNVPDNVRRVDFVPMAPLLSTCSAIVHHGGAGTRNNAFVKGVPQILAPGWMWDEEFVADNITEAGAGTKIDPDNFTASDMHDSLTKILSDDTYWKSAALLQRDMLGNPSPAEVVRNLEQMVADRR